MPIRAMSSGEPSPCTVHEYFSSAQPQLPSSPITKQPDRAADVLLARLRAARQHLHLDVDGTRYLSSCVVLQLALPTVHATAAKACHADALSLVSGQALRFVTCRKSHAATCNPFGNTPTPRHLRRRKVPCRIADMIDPLPWVTSGVAAHHL
jgi:hypothetical protein